MTSGTGVTREYLVGCAIGAALSAGAILMPYRAILETVSSSPDLRYPAAGAIALAAVVARFQGRRSRRTGDVPERARDPETVMGLRPIEWLRRNGILEMDGDGAREAIREALASTLRPASALKGWRRFLGLCLVAHSVGETVDGRRPAEVIKLMADVARRSGTDLERRMEEFAARYTRGADANPRATTGMLALQTRHGMMETFLLGALAGARKASAMPSGMFPWVKDLDRPLWYALNDLGRRAHHVEGAAAIAHYEAELAAGDALFVPMVHRAVGELHDLAVTLTAPVRREVA